MTTRIRQMIRREGRQSGADSELFDAYSKAVAAVVGISMGSRENHPAADQVGVGCGVVIAPGGFILLPSRAGFSRRIPATTSRPEL